MIIGFKSDTDAKFKEYISVLSDNLNEQSIVLNPFRGKISYVDDTVILIIKPIYLNVPLIGFPLLAMLYIAFGLHRYMIIILFFSSLGILWTPTFFRFMLKAGLRKKGYTKPIEFL